MSRQHTSYVSHLFSDRDALNETIKLIINTIQENVQPDLDFVIVGTGVSGTVPAAIVAYILDVDLVVVRKDGVSSHSEVKVEGMRADAEAYVFVDDFICTGETIKYVQKQIEHVAPACRMEGMVSYNEGAKWRDRCSLKGYLSEHQLRRWPELASCLS